VILVSTIVCRVGLAQQEIGVQKEKREIRKTTTDQNTYLSLGVPVGSPFNFCHITTPNPNCLSERHPLSMLAVFLASLAY
jgi:hypothetical protein